VKGEISTLYFRDKNTGNLCYFYICPGVDQNKITPYHPYHIVRWRQNSMDVSDYFKGKIDLQKLNYEIYIKTEHTTMVEKWREISPALIDKK
jgi:intein-encoded DNA endonuclease-like protein